MSINRRSKKNISKKMSSIKMMNYNKISCKKNRLKKSIRKCNLKGGLYQIPDEQTRKITKLCAFGYMYQTLNNHEINSDVLVYTPKTLQHVNSSFEVAPGDQIDLYICSTFNWQSRSLVFSDGTRCGTALNKYTKLEKLGKNLINTYSNEDGQTLYSSKYDTMDILLRMKIYNYNEIDEINFNGYIYKGQWYLGQKHGKGIETLPDGETYEGDWEFNKRNGKGKQVLPGGEIYEGDWIISMREGNGKQTLPNGEIYIGQWYFSYKHGKGKQVLPDGETYEGDWYYNVREGKGKQTLPDGETYEGDWYYNKRQGYGKQNLPDGEIYEGDWYYNKRQGYGKQTLPSGEMYEGEWDLNKRHGKGIQYLADGETYEGDWYYNVREGYGKQTLPNGEIFEGYWQFGNKNGIFIKTYINREKKTFLYFTDNIFITKEISEYIIDNQFKQPENKYITILIDLHGSDIINSKCLLHETNHVRLITPAMCGTSNYVSDICTLLHFNISYNTTHIVMNDNASTYQKNEKIIELLNKYFTKYNYDKQYDANKRPLIDHNYSTDYKFFGGIYLIDTNYNPNLGKSVSPLFFPRIDETIGIDFETQRPKYLIELSSADIIKELIEGLHLNEKLKEILEQIPNPPDGNKLITMNEDEIDTWMDKYFEPEPELHNIICNYMLGMKSRNTFFSEQKFNKIKDRSIALSDISNVYSLNQFNILPEILNHLPNRIEHINIYSFFRSTLINILIDMGYDTINIIDLSCRDIRQIFLDDESNLTKDKNYQCTYEQSGEQITHISDNILSTGM